MKLSLTLSFSLLLALLSLLKPTRAWTSITTTKNQRTTKPTTLFQLKAAPDEEHNQQPSRRTFFSNVAGNACAGWMAVATSTQLSAPADAIDVVKTTSVCDPAVSVWQKNGRLIYLLGTAHVSAVSAELAGQLVKDIHPNAVFVELDRKRISGNGVLAQQIQQQQGQGIPTSKFIIPQVQMVSAASPVPTDRNGAVPEASAPIAPSPQASRPRNNPVMQAATVGVGNAIKGMYKKLDNSGFKAGEEFVVTMREGVEMGADVVLGDQDVEVTLRRVTEALAKTDLKVLMSSSDSELEKLMPNINVDSDFSNPQVRDDFANFVEVVKAKENVRKIMSQLQKTAPALYQALVTERDGYMAAALNGLNDYNAIVAVVGIAHTDGIEMNLNQNGWKAANLNCPTPSR
jgi:hypothetical protein